MDSGTWQVEMLRATVFSSVVVTASPREWWENFAGSASVDLTVSEGPAGHRTARGTLAEEKAAIQLVCQPGRIDWTYVRATVAEDGKLELAPGADFVEALETFVKRLQGWATSAPPATRLALGGVLRIPVQTKVEGYEKLKPYLPAVTIDPNNSSDFRYQINRPRPAKALPLALILNRLSIWSVATVLLQVADAAANGLTSSATSMFCRLELDISTAVENSEIIGPEIFSKAFCEMQGLAVEITQKGDVP